MRKCTALFYEFVETGTAKELGFETVDDLRDNYPTFYWNVVRLYIQDGLRCLNVTQKGKDWMACKLPASVDSQKENFLAQ